MDNVAFKPTNPVGLNVTFDDDPQLEACNDMAPNLLEPATNHRVSRRKRKPTSLNSFLPAHPRTISRFLITKRTSHRYEHYCMKFLMPTNFQTSRSNLRSCSPKRHLPNLTAEERQAEEDVKTFRTCWTFLTVRHRLIRCQSYDTIYPTTGSYCTVHTLSVVTDTVYPATAALRAQR
jgi:hypothetical protein